MVIVLVHVDIVFPTVVMKTVFPDVTVVTVAPGGGIEQVV
jgi:hypothetical protein